MDHGKIKGYGEGAPRSYVTGETQESAAKSIRELIRKGAFPWELRDVSRIWDFVDSLPNGKDYNSAICAIEMALLDALARKFNRSIIEYFPFDFLGDTVHYGASIPIGSKKRVMQICRLIKKIKINKLRIKMGKDLEENIDRFETVKMVFDDDYDLRLDVNGSWNRELAFAHIPLIKKYKVKVVEQPMSANDPDISAFAGAMKNYGVIIMADELACSMNDIKKIIKGKHYGMVNVRLSKCGGFRRSLRIIELLRDNGLSFQIGCQLGESGILSAAGRVLCLLCRDAVYYDGSYDEFLLKENTTLENVSFGVGGEAGPLGGPGLGVKVSSRVLKRLSNSSRIAIKNPN